ncbi:DegT/DnrJ/EryC1/StrS family aminotransferase [Candidatus Peribacteria bacterium]|nr:DegT/DnrJ/EryC1/StrS family aminotransferase [Candidatus Peribacteria bacterium]
MDRRPTQLGVGTLALTAQEKANVLQVLESNRLSYGPFIRKFEQMFAKMHGCSHAVFMNSGTNALSIAVACLKEVGGWKDGDEVIVPALTFVATANVVLEHNLIPVFVDCDPKTYNMDPAKIEAKLTPKTRAIMPVHLFGQIADMDPILAIAKKHDLRVIEDSCETVGVTYKGKPAGSFGDISCFSTYVAHLVVTGVGGLAVTDNAKYAEIIRSLANHGRDNIYVSIDDDKDIDGAKFHEVIRRRFRFVRRGYSCRGTEMEAAIGVGQLERFPEIVKARQTNAGKLINLLKPFEKYLQLPWYDTAKQEHAFMMFPIVVKDDAPFKKIELIQHLEDWNVETREMMPLINQPCYEWMKLSTKDYPVADWVNRCGFYIGCHQGFTDEHLTYIRDVCADFFTKFA